jgi:8-oxo-dGTP pyrophosphatase MutT (NUDIX family)
MQKAGILAVIEARLASALARTDAFGVRFDVDGATAGWLARARAEHLAGLSHDFVVEPDVVRFAPQIADADTRTRAIDSVARALAAEGGLSAWRNERYAIRPAFDAAPWFHVERAAARWFGFHTYAVHVNGVAVERDPPMLWLARRSPTKAIDPGLFDTLVGGGIAERDGVFATLEREAFEEAGIPRELAAGARAAGHVDVRREAADGLQRETIFVYDLVLPADFAPASQDGEVAEFRCVAVEDALQLVATGATTLDCALITLDLLLRNRELATDDATRTRIAAWCRQPLD